MVFVKSKHRKAPRSNRPSALSDGEGGLLRGRGVMVYGGLWFCTLLTLKSFQGSFCPTLDTQPMAPCMISTDRHKAVRPIANRMELGSLLEEMQFTSGAEIGVYMGQFALRTLQQWESCRLYYLIDNWGQVPENGTLNDNYRDWAASKYESKRQAGGIYHMAKRKLRPYENITQFMRLLSVAAATQIPDDSLDYIYIDARHDYCGVLEDLVAYWPKLKEGGIMAGHDYLNAADMEEYILEKNLTGDAATAQDWSMCANGTTHPGAVKGAVHDFFTVQHRINVQVAYKETTFRTWIVQKPVVPSAAELCGQNQ